MKSYPIIVLAVFLPTIAPAQTQDSTSTFDPFEGTAPSNVPHELILVDSVAGVSADELYSRAKRWFADMYKDAQEVIQLDDAGNRTIMGKAVFTFTTDVLIGGGTRRGHVKYSIEIACKDGRYRLRMYDYIHSGNRYYDAQLKAFVGPTDMGVLYDGTPCAPNYSAGEKHKAKICEREVKPQLEAHDTAMVMSVQLAMETPTATAPASSGAKSDW